jgi:hypothetical protein
MNIFQCSSYPLFLTAVVSLFVSCSRTKSPAIEQLEQIKERDFPDIPTVHQLLPFKLFFIKDFEQYSLEYGQHFIDSISNLGPPSAPDLRILHHRCNLRGNNVFFQLIREKFIIVT